MKLSTFLLAGFVSANTDKYPPSHPVRRLDRVIQFSGEILESGAFNNKSEKWINKWKNHFRMNISRMRYSFGRGFQRCGFYDEK